ncbi:MAG: V-type ATP synthase subunit K [Kiritimatiellae bacterium]|nr:V-type ATP synthase subunit K [Kiritimatiellia bacterium]
MNPEVALGVAGAIAAISFSAVGSAIGTGKAAAAAIGAWKKCYAQNKPAPFQLLSFVGAPITQTLYGMILMFSMISVVKGNPVPGAGLAMLVIGIVAGIGIGSSAIFQGIAGAGASNAQAETGKGFTNYLASIGIVETVAIFVMVFALIGAGNLAQEEVAAEEAAPAAVEAPAVVETEAAVVEAETAPVETVAE